MTTTQLREWAAERAEVPLWLFEDSYSVVGDLAETIALILPPAREESDLGLTHWIEYLRNLAQVDIADRRSAIEAAWDRLGPTERFIFNKLITGGWRIGVSQKLMTRAMAMALDAEEAEMAHRLMGAWTPETTTWCELTTADTGADLSRPYPFLPCLRLRSRPRSTRSTRRLARRMEMGRHPRPSDPARRATFRLVPGRSVDHRSFPRTRPFG